MPLGPDRLWHPSRICTICTEGPFPGGKARPGRDADHSPPSSAEVKKENGAIPPLPQAPSLACSRPLYLTLLLGVWGQCFFWYGYNLVWEVGTHAPVCTGCICGSSETSDVRYRRLFVTYFLFSLFGTKIIQEKALKNRALTLTYKTTLE
jgi:hypothetical protein